MEWNKNRGSESWRHRVSIRVNLEMWGVYPSRPISARALVRRGEGMRGEGMKGEGMKEVGMKGDERDERGWECLRVEGMV